MRATATTYPRYVRQSNAKAHQDFYIQRLRNYFRHLIEATDWDEELIAQEKWVNKVCLGIAIFSALYFTPILLSSLMK